MGEMVIERFVDPYTKEPLERDERGNLFRMDGDGRVVYANRDGCNDFVHPDTDLAKERGFYDDKYSGIESERLTLHSISRPWVDSIYPHTRFLLESLGDLTGKKILLLGNGSSFKEFYLLSLGASIIYSDLSIEVVARMRSKFKRADFAGTWDDSIEFHAIDALHLPFPDGTFDIIYGWGFVHHMEDLDQFLTEVKRCLKENGRCRFVDDAYSPLWQFMKRTVLRPVQILFHRKYGVSPEDQRATMRGGYRYEEIVGLKERYGFRDIIFIRKSFFMRIFWRAYSKVFGGDRRSMGRVKPIIRLLNSLDGFLERTAWMRNNSIFLVWGFDT
ncbi:MAG: class I SAM-dependent methyltransferase [bacterium]|nr:MAG: class I SAM-dependent methyltransferase [bacterium]